MKNAKDVIVGIDPGVTTAYAILDFDGKLVELNSKKNLGQNSLIAIITKKGKVRVVATDVISVPHLVLNTAKKLQAVIIKPSKEIGAIKKKKVVREFLKENRGLPESPRLKRLLKVKNKHELAALCAAVTAYKHFGQLLNKIKYEAKEEKTKILISLLTKKSANIKEALKST